MEVRMTVEKPTTARIGGGEAFAGDEASAAELRARIAELEARLDALEAYLPMLARMAFFEHWSTGGSIPAAILRLEEWVKVDDWQPNKPCPPEMLRWSLEEEPLPSAAQCLQDSYDRRTSPWACDVNPAG
jgi:hypothetical protein